MASSESRGKRDKFLRKTDEIMRLPGDPCRCFQWLFVFRCPGGARGDTQPLCLLHVQKTLLTNRVM